MESSVESILKREFPGVPFKIKETKNKIELIIYVIPYKQRGQGKGTEFINRIIELAKESQKNIIMTASDGYLDSDGDMTLSQLKKWYEKLGFSNTKGDEYKYQVTSSNYN